MSVSVADKFGTVHYGLMTIKNYWWGAIIETSTPSRSTEYRIGTKALNIVLVTGPSMRFLRVGPKVIYAQSFSMPGNCPTWSRLHPSAYPQFLMPWRDEYRAPRVPRADITSDYDLTFIADMQRRARDEPRNFTMQEAWDRYEEITVEQNT